MLTHDNWLFEAEAIEETACCPRGQAVPVPAPGPSFAKVLQVASRLVPSLSTAPSTSWPTTSAPPTTVMGAVPRVFEKVYNRVVTGAREAGGLKYKIFLWSLGVGRRVSRSARSGGSRRGCWP